RNQAHSKHYEGGFLFAGLSPLSGSLRVGWRTYPGGISEAVPESEALTVDCNLDAPFLFGSHLALYGGRDISYSIYDTGDAPRTSYIVNRYSATVGFGLPRDLIARVAYTFEIAQYPDPSAVPMGNP